MHWEFMTMMLTILLARRGVRSHSAVLAFAGALIAAPAWANSQVYVYDQDGRLIQVEYDAGEKVDYPVDDIGNRAGIAKQPPPTETAAFTSATISPAENAGSVSLTIVRSGSTAAPASLTCATKIYGTAIPGSDYTAMSALLEWGIGDAAAKTCTVPLTNDALAEPNETFRVELTNASGFSVISPRFVTVTIRDDETPATLAFTASEFLKLENVGGTAATISVSRAGGSVGTVSVNYATSNLTAVAGSDYVSKSGTVTWTDGDMSNKTFTVSVNNDSTPESDEAFRITLSAPTGNSVIGSPAVTEVSIPCNDGYNCQ